MSDSDRNYRGETGLKLFPQTIIDLDIRVPARHEIAKVYLRP